jgi:glycosyltransferase involved in cell wall biosynthesis
MVRVSVVMACRNGAAHLEAALEAVLGQRWDGDAPWELVFADNGSSDGSRAIFEACAARHPGVPARGVDAGARPGKSFALNRGIAAAAGRSIVLADADDIVAPGWLSAMGAALERHDFVAACNELSRLNGGPAGGYRAVPASTWVLPFAPFARCTAGATMGFTRALYAAVGGFDPRFQPEDDEFCIRAHLAGFALVTVPGAVVHYRLRRDPRAIYAQARQYSRTEVQVAAAYRDTGPPQRGPWRGLAREALAVARGYAGRALRPGRADPAAAARLAWRLGVVAGQLDGVLRHRAAPTLGRPPRARVCAPLPGVPLKAR